MLNDWGGKRKGAGRKQADTPSFIKRFRATLEERTEFMGMLTGDARQDFLTVLEALRFWKSKDKDK